MNNEKKYWVKGGWIFNLESIHDKAYCILYDIQEHKIQLPIEIAGKIINSEGDIFDLIDEAGNLEWKAKAGKVTGKEYGRIKALVEWRIYQRYARCMASGMDERTAAGCFEDL